MRPLAWEGDGFPGPVEPDAAWSKAGAMPAESAGSAGLDAMRAAAKPVPPTQPGPTTQPESATEPRFGGAPLFP